MQNAKRLVAAVLWLAALTTWGGMAHVFTGVPDLGLLIGAVAALGILLGRERLAYVGRWSAGAPTTASLADQQQATR